MRRAESVRSVSGSRTLRLTDTTTNATTTMPTSAKLLTMVKNNWRRPVIMPTASCESRRSRSPKSSIRALMGAKSVSLVANNAADDLARGARRLRPLRHPPIDDDLELLQPLGLFGIGDDLVSAPGNPRSIVGAARCGRAPEQDRSTRSNAGRSSSRPARATSSRGCREFRRCAGARRPSAPPRHSANTPRTRSRLMARIDNSHRPTNARVLMVMSCPSG